MLNIDTFKNRIKAMNRAKAQASAELSDQLAADIKGLGIHFLDRADHVLLAKNIGPAVGSRKKLFIDFRVDPTGINLWWKLAGELVSGHATWEELFEHDDEAFFGYNRAIICQKHGRLTTGRCKCSVKTKELA